MWLYLIKYTIHLHLPQHMKTQRLIGYFYMLEENKNRKLCQLGHHVITLLWRCVDLILLINKWKMSLGIRGHFLNATSFKCPRQELQEKQKYKYETSFSCHWNGTIIFCNFRMCFLFEVYMVSFQLTFRLAV